MKTTCLAVIVSLLVIASACAQKVNDPADAESLKALVAGYEKAANARDFEWYATTFFEDGALQLPPNTTMVAGKEAVQAAIEATFGQFGSVQETVSADEVLSSGDLAVVRGAWTWTAMPKATEMGAVNDRGKWTGTFRRQADGAWKCYHLIWNSDMPAQGTTPNAVEELALLEIERAWVEAALKNDPTALESILATDFVSLSADGIKNKRQYLAGMKSSATRIESGAISEVKPMVFGDTAVVHGLWTEKSTTGGKDSSGRFQWTDTFVKRNGRWQCVAGYSTKLEP